MPNLVALILTVSDKKVFKDLEKKVSEGIIIIFSKNSEEDHGRNISVKFHQFPISSFSKEEKVNRRTDGRTADKGP